MPPAPSGPKTSYGPSFVPEARGMIRRDYTLGIMTGHSHPAPGLREIGGSLPLSVDCGRMTGYGEVDRQCRLVHQISSGCADNSAAVFRQIARVTAACKKLEHRRPAQRIFDEQEEPLAALESLTRSRPVDCTAFAGLPGAVCSLAGSLSAHHTICD